MRGELHERPIFWLWPWVAVFIVVATGCSLAKSVRVESGEQTFTITAKNAVGSEFETIEVDEDEWLDSLRENAKTARPFTGNPLQAAREFLGGVPEVVGNYLLDMSRKRLTGEDSKTRDLHLHDPDEQMARDYLSWCENGRNQKGDCLGLLERDSILWSEERFAVALAFALGSETREAMEEELLELTNGAAIVKTVVSTVVMLLIVLSLPDPVTKGIAAVMTLATIAYLGYDIFYKLINGWIDMTQAANQATTFAELQEAGQAYGRRIGEKAARVLVMVAMAAMGSSASQLAAKVPKLPNFPQAAAAMNTATGIDLAIAIGRVQTVAATSGGINITVAPTTAVLAVRDAADVSSRARPSRVAQKVDPRPRKAGTVLNRGNGGIPVGTPTPNGGIGYKSFSDFKEVYGKAGEKKEWHHIVGQHDANVEKFGPEMIHPTFRTSRS